VTARPALAGVASHRVTHSTAGSAVPREPQNLPLSSLLSPLSLGDLGNLGGLGGLFGSSLVKLRRSLVLERVDSSGGLRRLSSDRKQHNAVRTRTRSYGGAWSVYKAQNARSLRGARFVRSARFAAWAPKHDETENQFAKKIDSISLRTFSSVCARAIAISFTISVRAVSSMRRSPKESCLFAFRRYKSRKTSATS
jgi:hypothetical protein